MAIRLTAITSLHDSKSGTPTYSTEISKGVVTASLLVVVAILVLILLCMKQRRVLELAIRELPNTHPMHQAWDERYGKAFSDESLNNLRDGMKDTQLAAQQFVATRPNKKDAVE